MIQKLLKSGLRMVHSTRFSTQLNQFVPKHNPVKEKDVKLLEKFIFESERILILTGAGISTESGIPDYRSEEVGLYARTNHRPIQHQEFLKLSAVRQRYWARNFVGWSRFSNSQPNAVHFCVKNLEIDLNKVHTVVTQNVDSLHFKAGSKNVVELHGTAFRVICLECQASYSRYYIQDKLMENNSINFEDTVKMIRPDGDVDIPQGFIRNFSPPYCDSCRGPLKPDITFFGDNVPKNRVDLIKTAVTNSDLILVLGSSLSVFSGYRIILQAVEERKKVGIVNIGSTRADQIVDFKIEGKCGDILPRIC